MQNHFELGLAKNLGLENWKTTKGSQIREKEEVKLRL